MAVVAPVVKGLAGSAAKSAGTAAAVKKSAAVAKPAAAPTSTAAARAAQLRSGGSTRAQGVRALKDEYGASPAEAGDLYDGAPAAPPAPRTAMQNLNSANKLQAIVPKGSAASAGGGALLGAIAYVLALTYMRSGMPGVKAWFAAKFLNKVSS